MGVGSNGVGAGRVLNIDAATPVVVGAAQVVNRPGPSFTERSATALMLAACRKALGQTGAAGRLAVLVDEILVPRGTWPETDPGRAIAGAIGAAEARSVRAEVGVSQHTLLQRAVRAVAAGELRAAVVVGGENRWSEVEAARHGAPSPEPPPAASLTEPDEVIAAEALPLSQLELDRGLAFAAHQYAIIESAYRHHLSRSPADHLRHLGVLWERMAAVATTSEAAWNRQGMSAGEIVETSPANRLIAEPYRKWMVSQWNVDQAAALVLTTAATARELGIPEPLWVYPLAIATSEDVVPVSERGELHRWPACSLAATAALEAAGVNLRDVIAVDLYSCFPVAVEVQAAEIGLPIDRDLTVTGGMTFAGGPFNNYSLQSAAAMVEVLRSGSSGSIGLTTAVSGFLTKPGVALWASTPPVSRFAGLDVTAAAAAVTTRLRIDSEYLGAAKVVGVTAAPTDGGTELLAVVESEGGIRTVAASDDHALVGRAADEDLVGTVVDVNEPGHFVAP